MNDTVTRLMGLADDYAKCEGLCEEQVTFTEHLNASAVRDAARQALQDELTRLFTPLSDEQVAESRAEANRGYWIEADHYRKAFRDAEQAHGIGERNEIT